MALRLTRKLEEPRTIDIGYGVEVDMQPFTYAQFKEAEAAAARLSEGSGDAADAAAREAIDDEDMPPEVEDAVRGRYGHALLLILVVRHASGWRGIVTDGEAPAPLTHATVAQFLDLFPGAAQTLAREVMAPAHWLVSEGNGSAPSQGTGTPAA